MKKIYFLKVIFVLSFLITNTSISQLQSFQLGIQNMIYGDTLGGSDNVLYFDMIMLHTNPGVTGPFNYAAAQYGMTFNPAFANGGTLRYRIVGSDLPSSMLPNNPNVSGNQLRMTGNLPSYPGFEISTVFPGTKIVRMRLSTSALSFANVPLKLKWAVNTGGSPFNTLVFAFMDHFTTDITNNGTYYVDSTGIITYPLLISPETFSQQKGTIKFLWHKYQNSPNYTLQVFNDSLMNHLLVDDSLITDTSKTVSHFNFGSKYYWRIRGVDSSHNFVFSYINEFITIPFQVSPGNNSTGLFTTVNFSWNKVMDNVSKYSLTIYNDSLQSGISYRDSIITDTLRTVGGLLKNKKYFWKVTSTDSTGYTEGSALWSFTTAPPVVTLVSPPDNITGITPSITFRWNRTFVYPSHYTLKISNDSLQTSVVFADSSITDTFKTYNQLSFSKKYFWTITAKDSFGISFNSPVWDLSIMPLQLSPVNNITNVPVNVLFTWRRVFSSAIYTLKIGKDPLFNDVFYSDSTITDTSKQIQGLSLDKRYYWQVIIKDSLNNHYNSEIWSFVTVPLLISPTNNETGVSVSPTFRWHKFFNYPVNYTLKISRDAAQNLPVIIDSLITDTTNSIIGLNPTSLYYWSISARDSTNNMVTSSVWKFFTAVSTFLISPANLSEFNTTFIIFTWHRLNTATGYRLMVSSDYNFTTTILNDSTLTDTTKSFTIIREGRYFWKVLARNSAGYFYESSTWSFMKDIPTPVELLSFISEINLNNASLKWSTAHEENNAGFDVERSDVNGAIQETWINAGHVDGMGNSTTNHDYAFVDRNLSSGKYKYRLKQSDYNGNFTYYELTEEVSIGTPVKFELSQNYPNPFNPVTVINFQIPVTGKVLLVVYDMSGKEIATLVNENKLTGYYEARFNGDGLSSGVYYYTLSVDNVLKGSKKMLIIK